MKTKHLLLYIFTLALLTYLTSRIKYQLIIGNYSIEIYLFGVILIGASAGVYLAYSLILWKFTKDQKMGVSSSQKTTTEIELSLKEKEILQCFSLGLTNQEIADYLKTSTKSIRLQSSNVLLKLDSKRRTQAVKKARDLGIIEHSIEEPNS